jgi:hypothetical protein
MLPSANAADRQDLARVSEMKPREPIVIGGLTCPDLGGCIVLAYIAFTLGWSSVLHRLTANLSCADKVPIYWC